MSNLVDFKKQFLVDPNEVLLIKSLFMHPGWVRFEERINEVITVLDSNIETLTDGKDPLTQDSLPLLNQQINERRMLRLMLLFKEDLLDGVKTQEPEEQESDNFKVPEQ